MVGSKKRALSEFLPPLVFGTATFSYQFNPDPYALGPEHIVKRALDQGIRAFDTSPYYGDAETILGDALNTQHIRQAYPRDQYYILTKVGRVAGDCFDYSPEWIRHSVTRSCARFHTDYLDVVYLHDVEFVMPQDVLTAIKELRRIRDASSKVRHVGICGYPVEVLCALAEMILHETGEPLDIVQSYANYSVQNTRLLSVGLPRFIHAGVDVVTSASPLGMGLLRREGPPVGALGDWHPAPNSLREVCAEISKWTDEQGEKLEVVAVRFALENWLRDGAVVGTMVDHLGTSYANFDRKLPRSHRIGVNVIGVSKIEELDETMRVYRSVLEGFRGNGSAARGISTPSGEISDHDSSLRRREQINEYAKHIKTMLGRWVDFAWVSPDLGFVNKENKSSDARCYEKQSENNPQSALLTPPPEPDTEEAMSSTTTF